MLVATLIGMAAVATSVASASSRITFSEPAQIAGQGAGGNHHVRFGR